MIKPTPTLNPEDSESLLRDLENVCSPEEAQRRMDLARERLKMMSNTEAEDAIKWAKAYGIRMAAWEAALNWQHHHELAETGLGPVQMRKDWASASLSLAHQLRDMAEKIYPSRK